MGETTANVTGVPPREKFRLVDLLVLVATVGLGIRSSAWFNDEWGGFIPPEYVRVGPDIAVIGLWNACGEWISGSILVAFPCLYVINLRILILGVARKAGWQRRGESSAYVATALAAVIVLAVTVLRLVGVFLSHGTVTGFEGNWAWALLHSPTEMGACVAAVWIPFAARRRGFRSRGWTDRATLLLGAYWMVSAALLALFEY